MVIIVNMMESMIRRPLWPSSVSAHHDQTAVSTRIQYFNDLLFFEDPSVPHPTLIKIIAKPLETQKP